MQDFLSKYNLYFAQLDTLFRYIMLLIFHANVCRYGLPTMDSVPGGFSPLAEVWGKGKNRDPLLVSFVHPSDWVVTLPSQDVNGEDGTIQAGEYAKGDTATFFVYSEPGKVEVSNICFFFENDIRDVTYINYFDWNVNRILHKHQRNFSKRHLSNLFPKREIIFTKTLR